MLKNLHISTRILLLVYVFLSLMTFGFLFSLTRFESLGHDVSVIADEEIPLIRTISELSNLQLQQAVNFQRAMRFGKFMILNDAAKTSYLEAKKRYADLDHDTNARVKRAIEITRKLADGRHDPAEWESLNLVLRRLERIRSEHTAYSKLVNGVFADLESGELSGIEDKARDIEAVENDLIDRLSKFLAQIENFAALSAMNVTRNKDITSSFMTSISAASMCLAILLGLILSRSIINPLKSAADIARRITAGERDIHFKVTTQDEVGQLLRAINDMLESLHAAKEDLRKANVELEDKVRARTAELNRSNRDLEAFAGVIAHDLKSPLFKVQMIADTLNQFYGEQLDDKAKEFLQKMRGSLLRMQNLIDALLDYSVITKNEHAFETADLNQVLKDVVSDLEAHIQTKGAKVEIGPLPTVEGNPALLRQLFQNLVGNALKYSRPDVAPVIVVSAEAVRLPGAKLGTEIEFGRIRVRDNGIGFPEESAGEIFDPFKRLHTNDAYGGVGIGLATCRKIAEHHHGAISATGRPGDGATFTIDLPLRQPQAKAA